MTISNLTVLWYVAKKKEGPAGERSIREAGSRRRRNFARVSDDANFRSDPTFHAPASPG